MIILDIEVLEVNMKQIVILLFLVCSCKHETIVQSEKNYQDLDSQKWAKVDYLYESKIFHDWKGLDRITTVQAKYGLPDYIQDNSGSQGRIYTPDKRPDSEWPAYSPRTFYYLKLNKYFKFIYGRQIETGIIPKHFYDWHKNRIKTH